MNLYNTGFSAGIVAALPHVSAFVAGHSMAAFEQVVEVVGHA